MLRPKACDFRGHGHLSAVITLINCTMGVVALAMPYCFQQCGVLLSVVSIIITGISCTGSCDLLIRLCLTHKVTSFEKTCFRHLGILGKLLTELSIIGLMLGFIVGYNVSLADLGCGIVSKLFTGSQTAEGFFLAQPDNLRVVVLSLFMVVIAPLCFLTRVQSLSKFSAFAMLFYCLMILHMVFIMGVPKLFTDFPLSRMNWWRPAGLINCLPIFFASLFCQTQLQTVYCGSQHLSVGDMRRVVRLVVVIIAIAYSLFGFFGYLAFVDSGELPGNVFLIYPNDLRSLCVQAGFLFTVTVSIPLTLFPLRDSLSSFLFHNNPALTTDVELGSDTPVPKYRFRMMTICTLAVCFVLSLTTSKIEVIIQLTSSLAGSLVGYILPGLTAIYAFTHDKSGKERRNATSILFVGVMLLGFSLLTMRYAPDSVNTVPVVVNPVPTRQPAVSSPHIPVAPDPVATVEPGVAKSPISGGSAIEKRNILAEKDTDPNSIQKDTGVNLPPPDSGKKKEVDTNNGPARIDREPNEKKLAGVDAQKSVEGIVKSPPDKESANSVKPVKEPMSPARDQVGSSNNDNGPARIDREPNDRKLDKVDVDKSDEVLRNPPLENQSQHLTKPGGNVPSAASSLNAGIKSDDKPLPVAAASSDPKSNVVGVPTGESEKRLVKRPISSDEKVNLKKVDPSIAVEANVQHHGETVSSEKVPKIKEVGDKKPPQQDSPTAAMAVMSSSKAPPVIVKPEPIPQGVQKQNVPVEEKLSVSPKHPQPSVTNEKQAEALPVRLEVR